MAYAAMSGPCLLLHALQVIVSIAMDAKEGILMTGDFLLANTNSTICQVIDIVHL